MASFPYTGQYLPPHLRGRSPTPDFFNDTKVTIMGLKASLKASSERAAVESDVASDTTGIHTPTESQADEQTNTAAEQWDNPVKMTLARHLATEENVVIFVGQQGWPRRFVLNKCLLFERVPKFKERFEPTQQPYETPVLGYDLPLDFDPDAFETFVDWLYGTPLSLKHLRSPKNTIEQNDILFCELYELASDYDATELAQQAIAIFKSRMRSTTDDDLEKQNTYNVLEYIYANTPSGSALRGIALEAIVALYFADTSDEQTHIKTVVARVEEAQLDLLSAVKKHMQKRKCSSYRYCSYHQHIVGYFAHHGDN